MNDFEEAVRQSDYRLESVNGQPRIYKGSGTERLFEFHKEKLCREWASGESRGNIEKRIEKLLKWKMMR